MARKSTTSNVKKICGCVQWKECAHPWYVDYMEKARGRYRRNLDELIGFHAVDFAAAKNEARRAIVAWQDGRDAKDLQPADRPALAALLEEYRKRPGAGVSEAAQAKPIERTIVNGRKLGEHAAADVTRETLEAFRRQRPKIAGNRDLALLRAMFNWAVLGGLLTATPFKVGTVSAVKLGREEPRSRRLQPGEQGKLIAACAAGKTKDGRTWRGNRGLRDLIIAALETGCRRGELLSLQWWQVGADLFLPGGKTKSRKPRRIPVSKPLKAVLDARRHDPAGEPLPPESFVFGDEAGRRRRSLKTAWRLLCKRANVNGLHFHDLRREAGSRWMDAGLSLHTICRLLGHYNVSQTHTYLAASDGGDADAIRAYDERREARGELSYVDVFSGLAGNQTTPTDGGASEKTAENAVIH